MSAQHADMTVIYAATTYGANRPTSEWLIMKMQSVSGKWRRRVGAYILAQTWPRVPKDRWRGVNFDFCCVKTLLKMVKIAKFRYFPCQPRNDIKVQSAKNAPQRAAAPRWRAVLHLPRNNCIMAPENGKQGRVNRENKTLTTSLTLVSVCVGMLVDSC